MTAQQKELVQLFLQLQSIKCSVAIDTVAGYRNVREQRMTSAQHKVRQLRLESRLQQERFPQTYALNEEFSAGGNVGPPGTAFHHARAKASAGSDILNAYQGMPE